MDPRNVKPVTTPVTHRNNRAAEAITVIFRACALPRNLDFSSQARQCSGPITWRSSELSAQNESWSSHRAFGSVPLISALVNVSMRFAFLWSGPIASDGLSS